MTRNEAIDKALRELQGRFPLLTKKPVQKLTKLVVTTTLEVMLRALVEGEPVTLLGFGRLEVIETKARKGNVLRDGKAVPMEIPPGRAVRFKASAGLKNLLKERPMEKLGVKTDKGKEKTAKGGDGKDRCGCGEELDKTANVPKCPVHGTEPFESEKKGR